jgi:hypothetical protein
MTMLSRKQVRREQAVLVVPCIEGERRLESIQQFLDGVLDSPFDVVHEQGGVLGRGLACVAAAGRIAEAILRAAKAEQRLRVSLVEGIRQPLEMPEKRLDDYGDCSGPCVKIRQPFGQR